MHKDNFEARQIKRNKDKRDKKEGGVKDIGAEKSSSKNEMKSSKFFSKMQEVAKDDAARKEQRRKNKEEGAKGGFNRNFQPA